jgi:hypothetical protein
MLAITPPEVYAVRMKLFAIPFAILVVGAALARADLTIVQNVEGGGPITKMTIRIKGEQTRIDPSPEVSTIINNKTGEMLNLMNGQKKYLRLSGDKAKAVAEMAAKAGQKKAFAQKPKLVPTGRKETINGYEADEYTCEAEGFKANYWFSTTYPNAAEIMKQLQTMTPAAWNIGAQNMPDYRDFPGLPLRSDLTIEGKHVVTTIASVTQEPISDTDFAPPAGFTEMKMPDISSMLGGKQEAAKPKKEK